MVVEAKLFMLLRKMVTQKLVLDLINQSQMAIIWAAFVMKITVFSVLVIFYPYILTSFIIFVLLFLLQCSLKLLYLVLLYCAANHLARLDGSGGDDIDKLAITELFEVLVSLYFIKASAILFGIKI